MRRYRLTLFNTSYHPHSVGMYHLCTALRDKRGELPEGLCPFDAEAARAELLAGFESVRERLGDAAFMADSEGEKLRPVIPVTDDSTSPVSASGAAGGWEILPRTGLCAKTRESVSCLDISVPWRFAPHVLPVCIAVACRRGFMLVDWENGDKIWHAGEFSRTGPFQCRERAITLRATLQSQLPGCRNIRTVEDRCGYWRDGIFGGTKGTADLFCE